MNYFKVVKDLLFKDEIIPKIGTIFHVRGDFEMLIISSKNIELSSLKNEYLEGIRYKLFDEIYPDYYEYNDEDNSVFNELFEKIDVTKYLCKINNNGFRNENNNNYTEIIHKLRSELIDEWLNSNHKLRTKIYDFYKYADLNEVKKLKIYHSILKDNR